MQRLRLDPSRFSVDEEECLQRFAEEQGVSVREGERLLAKEALVRRLSERPPLMVMLERKLAPYGLALSKWDDAPRPKTAWLSAMSKPVDLGDADAYPMVRVDRKGVRVAIFTAKRNAKSGMTYFSLGSIERSPTWRHPKTTSIAFLVEESEGRICVLTRNEVVALWDRLHAGHRHTHAALGNKGTTLRIRIPKGPTGFDLNYLRVTGAE